MVNNLNSVPYKINTELLEFIEQYNDLFNLLLEDPNINKIIIKSKLTKPEYKRLESYLSKLELEENVLGLARVFSNLPEFYIPGRIDNRGRWYCISQYLNYQSNELAKALLLFARGEKLMKDDKIGISYFKAYGANCYGNKLDRKS